MRSLKPHQRAQVDVAYSAANAALDAVQGRAPSAEVVTGLLVAACAIATKEGRGTRELGDMIFLCMNAVRRLDVDLDRPTNKIKVRE